MTPRAAPHSTPPSTVSAAPTRGFFVDMLTKDIGLAPAILDLVDNSVDGASRLRGSADFDGLYVHLATSPTSFAIVDNCGGIPEELAVDYAFRFGRPTSAPEPGRVIGQFGVGMKRALFKLGRHFRVESKSAKWAFVVDVDVEKWRRLEEHDPKADWAFPLKVVARKGRGAFPEADRGTSISVDRLHEGVAEELALENFTTRLGRSIEVAHLLSIERGLRISLNGRRLKVGPFRLLRSDRLRPAHEDFRLHEGKLRVRIWAGLGPSEPEDCGWYVFCNGRLVLGPDRELTTGWGNAIPKIPLYHPQFARFRGYVHFDSARGALLPWNTTKTGVDQGSPQWRHTRQRMVGMMKDVTDFLNRLKREQDRAGQEGRTLLGDYIRGLSPKDLPKTIGTFVAPKSVLPPKTAEDTVRIQYDKPVGQVQRVQKGLRALGRKAGSYKAAGERTFEYFLEMECEE